MIERMKERRPGKRKGREPEGKKVEEEKNGNKKGGSGK
jgi:hypothetical protein